MITHTSDHQQFQFRSIFYMHLWHESINNASKSWSVWYGLLFFLFFFCPFPGRQPSLYLIYLRPFHTRAECVFESVHFDFFSLGLKSALEPQVCVVLSWKSKRSHSCFALLFSNIVTNAILHSQNQTASFEHWIWVASLDFNTKMSGLHTLYSCENGLHIHVWYSHTRQIDV